MKFGWINLFQAVILLLMLLPNIIYALRNKSEANRCPNRAMNAAEQIGRYGCIILTVLPLGVGKFGFGSPEAILIYFFGNAVLLAAYYVVFSRYCRKKTIKRALLAAALPAGIFLLNGVLLRHWLLAASAILFAVSHICVTSENAKAQ